MRLKHEYYHYYYTYLGYIEPLNVEEKSKTDESHINAPSFQLVFDVFPIFGLFIMFFFIVLLLTLYFAE